MTNGTVEPAMHKPWMVSKDCAWCLLPVIMASDVDGFNKMLFSRCHLVTDSAQVVNLTVI